MDLKKGSRNEHLKNMDLQKNWC